MMVRVMWWCHGGVEVDGGIRWDTAAVGRKLAGGYPRLGNPSSIPRTLRSHRSLIVPIFAQSWWNNDFFHAFPHNVTFQEILHLINVILMLIS
ncbi:hypothetical protein Tco_1523623 [Tanacetum coccineum]